MHSFEQPVGTYMTSPVHWIPASTSAGEVARTLDNLHHGSLPVVDNAEVIGVISQTDLVHLGVRGTTRRPDGKHLVLSTRPVKEVMTPEAIWVDPGATIQQAARLMLEHQVHHVYVVSRGALIGVISTRDLMLAVRDMRFEWPMSEIMSSPVFTIREDEPIAMATDRLERAHISGLVVVDASGWAVGSYSKVEALRAADCVRDTPVAQVMEPRILVLPARTPTYRAAAQAAETRVRSVIAVSHHELVGILSGLDFARVVAEG